MELFKATRIRHLKTTAGCPESNGVAERANQTLVTKAKCMLLEADMDTVWWGEALNTAAYVANRSPNSAIQYELPEERYTAGEVNVGHLRVFGSQCVVHVLRHKRKKFDPSGVKGIFVGYGETRKAYRILMADGTVRNERNVTVFERPVRKSESVLPSEQCPGGEVTDHQDSVGDEPSEHSSGGESSDELNEEEDFASADDDEQIPRRSGRIRRTTSN